MIIILIYALLVLKIVQDVKIKFNAKDVCQNFIFKIILVWYVSSIAKHVQMDLHVNLVLVDFIYICQIKFVLFVLKVV